MTAPHITLVGIGEDGLAGLSDRARQLINTAPVLAGGQRHHRLTPDFTGTRLDWSEGIEAGIAAIDAHIKAGQSLVVLASGDPLYFGIAKKLIAHFGIDKVQVLPAAGAVSLACAALGWSQPDVQVVTVHGRPLDTLNLYLTPGTRIIALTHDGETPALVAALLNAKGFGPSHMTVLERLGSPQERRLSGCAQDWPHPPCAALNTLALDLKADATAKPLSRLAGLPDGAYLHDGQLTKRHVRAITLSSLAPLPGQTLWDLGAGAGSISIEWLRADPACRALAVERDPIRAERIRTNAAQLGVPHLHVETSDILDILHRLEGSPHAIFIGGGVSIPGLLDQAWAQLKPGGRLVANAVLDKSLNTLNAFQKTHAGSLTHITIEGKAPITQYLGHKPIGHISEKRS